MASKPDPRNPFYGWYDVVELDILCDDDIWRPFPQFRPDYPVWYFSPDDKWSERGGGTIYSGLLFNYQDAGDYEVPYYYDVDSGLLHIEIIPYFDDPMDFIESFAYSVERSGGDLLLTGITDRWPIEICYRWHLRRNGPETVRK